MKEKHNAVGKICLFDNYGVIQPKNNVRLWMKIQPTEFSLVSKLVPPFNIDGTFANK